MEIAISRCVVRILLGMTSTLDIAHVVCNVYIHDTYINSIYKYNNMFSMQYNTICYIFCAENRRFVPIDVLLLIHIRVCLARFVDLVHSITGIW